VIRAVLVGPPGGPWRLFRQPQWMAEVRRDPAAAGLPRHHFDIEESAFGEALETLRRSDAGLDPFAVLDRLGAVAVVRP